MLAGRAECPDLREEAELCSGTWPVWLAAPAHVSFTGLPVVTAAICDATTTWHVVPAGMPANWVSLGDPGVEGNGFGSVAEWGSFGVELYRLSQLTGTSSYFAAAERIYRYVAAISPHMVG